MKKIILFFAAVVFITQANLLLAQPSASITESWTLLGTRSVDYLIDHDVITFPETKDSFTAVKFVVKNGPLNMFRCTLHFRGGESKNIEFPDNVKANDVRVVDLKGSYMSIEKVTFWYDTKTKSDKKAILEVWGSM